MAEEVAIPNKSILKSPALLEYIYETYCYPREHEQLKELREATVKNYKLRSPMSVPVDEGQLISMFLKVMNAKKTIEVGVFTGYSLLTTALALPHDAKMARKASPVDDFREIAMVRFDFAVKNDQLLSRSWKVVDNLAQCLGVSEILDSMKTMIFSRSETAMDYAREFIFNELRIKLKKTETLNDTLLAVLWFSCFFPSTFSPSQPSESSTPVKSVAIEKEHCPELPLPFPSYDPTIFSPELLSKPPSSQPETTSQLPSFSTSQVPVTTSSHTPINVTVNKGKAVVNSDCYEGNKDSVKTYKRQMDPENLRSILKRCRGNSINISGVEESSFQHITAIDLNREAYEVGLPFIQKAGVDHKINFIESAASCALDDLINDVITEINLLLPRLCLSNQLNTATHLAITALLTNAPLDAISLSALLDSLASQSDIAMPMSLLTRLRRSPMSQQHVAPINNTLVAAYFRKGQPKEAIKVFNWMVRSGSPFKLVEKFCGILVDGFCRSGMVLKALKVLRAMVAADICPHGELRKVVYRGLLREARIRERWGLMGLILGAREKEVGSFDFAFVDANKDGYIKYHEQLVKLIKIGGVIAYDNTLWFGTVALSDEDEMDDFFKTNRKIIREVNTFLANDNRFEISLVSIGDGLTICRRLY
ncbi:hypothetical protein F8388_006270 [Cannabis sativa]|uniref:Caffeoyl-CoA O-methyltransferase n=1 Tax=Cannabis sativa TaxID=3483 RepID=A0A7J6G9Q0_CANSA|nr:hypothetical protein F8388_006270 [Cannabis sativa]